MVPPFIVRSLAIPEKKSLQFRWPEKHPAPHGLVMRYLFQVNELVQVVFGKTCEGCGLLYRERRFLSVVHDGTSTYHLPRKTLFCFFCGI
jgi:hypothetical protein